MRKLTCVNYIFAFLVLPFSLLSQTNDRFIAQAVENADIEHHLNQYFTDYTVIHLPAEEIEAFLQRPEPTHNMLWMMPEGVVWNLVLESAPILSGTFDLYLEDTNGRRVLPLNLDKIHTFRAQDDNDDHRLTVNGDFIYGYTIQDGQEWYIEPVKRFVPEAASQTYVIYQSRHVRPIPNLKCGANDRADTPDIELAARGARDACYEVELAIAADYSMYEHYGSATAVFDQLEGIMNTVCGNFDTEFSEEVSFRISEMVVSVCATCDPWTETNEASDLLADFNNWGLEDAGFINDFDLAQLWTRRSLTNEGNSNVIGLAYVGAICTDSRFHILEDFTTSGGYLRVLAAHEIGHNFGCVHNFNSAEYNCFTMDRPDLIMDPSVSNSSIWSNSGSNVCAENSILRIESTLAENSCLSTCTDICTPVDSLQAEFDPFTPSLRLSWTAEGQQEFRVRVRDLTNNNYQAFFTTIDSIYLDSMTLELCTNYEILVDRLCGEEYGQFNSILVSTEAESVIRISNIQTRNCETESNTYDLDLHIEYDEVFDEGFAIIIDDQVYEKEYTQSPQFIKIEGLLSNGTEKATVMVKSNTYTSTGCAATAIYRAPNHACNFMINANFDDCELPLGWQYTNTYLESSNWQIGDSSRLVINFASDSGHTTINDNCMVYFDDDSLGPSTQFTGASSLLTPVMDLDDYEEIYCSFTYNFNAYYSNLYTVFTVDVFDGNNWVNILTDQEGSGCLPNNAWESSCNTYVEMDLAPYENALLQLRFNYSDGGQWAEFVAMDDFVLSAVKDASLLPVELVQFSAKSDDDKIILDWSTAQEINNDYFEVERSNDGRNFKTIDQVEGVGNSQQRQYYTLIDEEPQNGVNYYRLRQVDKDGAFQYSHIVSANIKSDESWRAYPNPIMTGSSFHIERLSDVETTTTFQLLNTSGQLLASYPMSPQENSLSLDLSDLISGVYILREIGGRSVRLVK